MIILEEQLLSYAKEAVLFNMKMVHIETDFFQKKNSYKIAVQHLFCYITDRL